ncbi:hypothetical protein REPUB_Repub04eG0086000 [Reevesia pubescens]
MEASSANERLHFGKMDMGLTETCGAATIGFPDEMCMVGAVGSPAVYNELHLEEVSDMVYNPLGNPPCGEICVRGKTMFSEYYKNPELTRESFKDGWFHTGDIGQMLPNGVVKIIDRKKILIKLSQGEYVALEYLENVYGVTPIVDVMRGFEVIKGVILESHPFDMERDLVTATLKKKETICLNTIRMKSMRSTTS